jgi:hypothetical protein
VENSKSRATEVEGQGFFEPLLDDVYNNQQKKFVGKEFTITIDECHPKQVLIFTFIYQPILKRSKRI